MTSVKSVRRKTNHSRDMRSGTGILREVSIAESFLFFTGLGEYTGELASSLADFLKKLQHVPLRSIEFHFRRGDFERWIKETVGDSELADTLSNIDRSLRGEKLSEVISARIENHINQLARSTRSNAV